MLEKDIENLIAKYPDEFFPNSGFQLLGQQVRLGKCYADIIFEDKYKRKIIVEVKRGILSRDASGQVMEYYGLLKLEHPNEFVELVLCANIVPGERKKYLEAIGIDCVELGYELIDRIATKHNYTFIDNSKALSQNLQIHFNTPIKKIKNSEVEKNHVWLFQANRKFYNIIPALSDSELVCGEIHWQVNQHKQEIKEGDIGIIWISGSDGGIYAITEILGEPAFIEENEIEKKYWEEIGEPEKSSLRVKMKVLTNLVNKPLFRTELKTVEGLKGLSIFKQPRGTNFSVAPAEWQIIKSMIYRK